MPEQKILLFGEELLPAGRGIESPHDTANATTKQLQDRANAAVKQLGPGWRITHIALACLSGNLHYSQLAVVVEKSK